MSDAADIPEAWGRAMAGVGATSLASLEALETAFRQLHPPEIDALKERLAPARVRLDAAVDEFRRSAAPAGLEAFHAQLLGGADLTLDALEHFLAPPQPASPAAGVLAAMRDHARAQEAFYPLRGALPPLGRYFVEPALHAGSVDLDPEPADPAGVGLHRAGPGDDADARGGFSLYVPERYSGDRAWPLVVALHGGSGHGRHFLWTWLREARSRRFLLLAPTSAGATWALDSPVAEARALRSMVDFVRERWKVDDEHILLTGLSDGATFALLAGLLEDAPYTALAPVSGVLHPACFALGNMDRAAGRRIYLVHGTLDWLFPVGLARGARDALADAQADLTYREIEDLSHTYPREENAAILGWLHSSLAL
ncbi:MAG: phospholipase [Myxococcota bacterium]|nr:phospholipase [Myxococcota bacterium]